CASFDLAGGPIIRGHSCSLSKETPACAPASVRQSRHKGSSHRVFPSTACSSRACRRRLFGHLQVTLSRLLLLHGRFAPPVASQASRADLRATSALPSRSTGSRPALLSAYTRDLGALMYAAI